MKPLVETNWLSSNLDRVRIFDATWHLPNSKRNAEDEFKKGHINGSLFFDIDKHSNKNSKLPHMMPDKEQWENIISNFDNYLFFLSQFFHLCLNPFELYFLLSSLLI